MLLKSNNNQAVELESKLHECQRKQFSYSRTCRAVINDIGFVLAAGLFRNVLLLKESVNQVGRGKAMVAIS